MQAIWLLLMDDDFMHAYEFGVVIECLDGISRRVFPRFFSYSADYPEKYMKATDLPIGTNVNILGLFYPVSNFLLGAPVLGV